jgi:predicted RNA-binding Zn-ribbon protein involved in translation (DUF1610 family)
MVERFLRRPNRVNIRRPLPPPPTAENQPSTHTTKKPILAVTGTKTDRICAICLGKLEPGTKITFCTCGKFFHVECISELRDCPLCNYSIIIKHDLPYPDTNNEGAAIEDSQGSDITEIVYQCPMCEAYVSENSEKCSCGAIFDVETEEIYLCPGCGHEVEPNAQKCENCDMTYE